MRKVEGVIMETITVKLNDSKAALLRKKAKKFGLLPDQFVTVSIEDLIACPEPDFEEAMQKVLSRNEELYKRLA